MCWVINAETDYKEDKNNEYKYYFHVGYYAINESDQKKYFQSIGAFENLSQAARMINYLNGGNGDFNMDVFNGMINHN